MGAQHLRVPAGLIRALCYPGGVRLSPRVTKTRPPEPEVDAVHIPYVYSPPTANTVRAEIVRPEHALVIVKSDDRLDEMGNLSNESYKFFKGSQIKSSNYYQCRGCGKEEYLPGRKTLHLKECRPLMQAIEERIRRDKVCVVCNSNTSKERWRIPLCSEICVAKWRFSQPEPWMTARQFVLAADPKLLRIKCESTHPNS